MKQIAGRIEKRADHEGCCDIGVRGVKVQQDRRNLPRIRVFFNNFWSETYWVLIPGPSYIDIDTRWEWGGKIPPPTPTLENRSWGSEGRKEKRGKKKEKAKKE